MDMEDIIGEWGNGKAWIDNFTRDFPTLENLADGVAISKQKNAPSVGTTTLMNAVREIPRSSVQQLPSLTAEVNGTKNSVDALVASFLLRRVVFNEDTFGNGLVNTMQMALQQALTVGFTPLRANAGKTFNKFSTMLEALHYNDVVIEPGVFDASNSRYFHVRTRVTKGALKDLIDTAKNNPKTKWNIPALQALLDAGAQSFDYNRWLSAPRQNSGLSSAETYDIITRYGVGAFYPIDVYSPQQSIDDDPLMSIESKSKFGYPRISMLVVDPAQLSPFGLSRARLASPMATYGNIYLQSTAKMQLLNSDPPILKTGLFDTETPLKRGVQWSSSDPQANVKLVELSNSTLEQFTDVMSYIDQNILSTMGISAVGATPPTAGVYQNSASTQAQNATTNLSSQQVTQIAENSIRQYGLTGLDLYISEQVGKTGLIVDDVCKDAINDLQPGFVGNDNVVQVDWEQYYERIQTWTVTVDLSISPDALAEKKQATTQDLYTTMKQTAGDDPVANAEADALGKSLIEDALPGEAQQIDAAGASAPPLPPPGTLTPVTGGATPPGQ
jgi:hypothetical protein